MTAHLPPHAGWPGQEPPQWGPPTPPPPPKKPSHWKRNVLTALAILFFGGCAAVVMDGANGQSTQNRPGTPSGVDPGRYSPDPALQPGGITQETARQAPSGPLTTFGAGTYEVGTGDGQVAPGRYKTPGPEDGDHSCYWARLKNTDGDLEAIIANGNAEGPTVVTVGPRDGAFETRCQWTRTG